MINQPGFDFLFDPVDLEAGIQEIAEATFLILPNVLDGFFVEKHVNRSDDFVVLAGSRRAFMDEGRRLVGFAFIETGLAEAENVVIFLSFVGGNEIEILLINRGEDFSLLFQIGHCLWIMDGEIIAGDIEIASPEFVKRDVVIENDVSGFAAGENRVLIGFDDVFEIDFDREFRRAARILHIANDAAEKKALGITIDEVLNHFEGFDCFQKGRIESIDAFDNDDVVVLPVVNHITVDPFGDDF